jgi:hypothetical protein
MRKCFTSAAKLYARILIRNALLFLEINVLKSESDESVRTLCTLAGANGFGRKTQVLENSCCPRKMKKSDK